MKPVASGHILRSQTVSSVDCLHYALSLPTSVVFTGIDSMAVLEQAFEAAKTFANVSRAQFAPILEKAKPAASNGMFEPAKTSAIFIRGVGFGRGGQSIRTTTSTEFRCNAMRLSCKQNWVMRRLRYSSAASRLGNMREPLLAVFGAWLLFPSDFAGRENMSRGSLLMRCVREGRELDYVSVSALPRASKG